MDLVEQQFISNGLSINYIEKGTGSPMLFLHNGAGMWQSWLHQIEHFSKNFTVYAIDWPGCGNSDYPEGALNMGLVESTLDDFIALKKLKNLYLIGNCIGASAALNYTIKNKENVKKLILLNMCPGDLIFPKIISKRYIKGLANRRKAKARMEVVMRIVFSKLVIRRMFPKNLFGKNMDKTDPLYINYETRQFFKKQAQSRLDLIFNAYTYNLKDIIENQKVPEHILIWGKENAILDLKSLGISHYEMLNSKEFYIIENSGHLCMYEQPDEVNSIIENYFNVN